MIRRCTLALTAFVAAAWLAAPSAYAVLVNAFCSWQTEQDGTCTVPGNVTAETFPGNPTRSRTGSIQTNTGGEASFTDFQGNTWLGSGNFNPPGNSLAWNAGSTGNSFTHVLDMSGLANLSLRMAIRSATNGPTPITEFSAIEYNTGSGFQTAASGADLLIPVGGNAFHEYTLDLSSLDAIEGRSSVALRFSFGTVPGSTSFRYDNIQFTAHTIPEPSVVLLAAMGAACLGGSRRRRSRAA